MDTCSICGAKYRQDRDECPECGANWIDQAAASGQRFDESEELEFDEWDD
jgi:rRNA maturation endonuclease Nob1